MTSSKWIYEVKRMQKSGQLDPNVDDPPAAYPLAPFDSVCHQASGSSSSFPARISATERLARLKRLTVG